MIENCNAPLEPKGLGVEIPFVPQEEFVIGVYSLVDEAIACELDRLRSQEGVVPSCRPGCCHCCRYHILTNIAEARTLGQYIRREFSADQLLDLRRRTRQWHEWDNSRPGRHPSSAMIEEGDLSLYDHSCPFDVHGACSIYPVRPAVCRAHFVSSHPRFCFSANDPDSIEEAPVVLSSVVEAAGMVSVLVRTQIEEEGLDFSRSLLLLPQWLAIEMGWDFSILP